MDLAEQLNALNVAPDVERGRVVGLYYNGDSEEEEAALPAKLEALGLTGDELGAVEPHPEGSDRGGYVPTLDAGPWYSDNEGWSE